MVYSCLHFPTVIIAQLIVNETSIDNSVFVINESRVVKGSNSSHLTMLKLTEKASKCNCLTLDSNSWYICTGTRYENILIVSENDLLYAASHHYQEKVARHCKLMK